MRDQFYKFATRQLKLTEKHPILIAVSGGVDSTVLAHLFHSFGFNIHFAHCNFGLRGEESDGDEGFCKDLAEKMGVPIHFLNVNAEEVAQKDGISIQEAARNIRYSWFYELCETHNYYFVATAHHLTDSIETVFINLLRGTGIEGLKGVPRKNDKIIRPLLFTTSDEIQKFAHENQIEFRTDSSNLKTEYTRNFIRHKIIPLFHELSPAFEEVFAANMANFTFNAELFKSQIQFLFHVICKKDEEGRIFVNLDKLKTYSHPEKILYEFLKKYGYNASQCIDMLRTKADQNGQQFFTETHIMYKIEETLVMSKKDELKPVSETLIYPENAEYEEPFAFITEYKAFQYIGQVFAPNVSYFDADLLEFPLILRHWRHGDRFVPYGMKGSKLVSDYLTDLKINSKEKADIYVLESAGKVAAVIGLRNSETFKVTPETETVFSLTPLKNM